MTLSKTELRDAICRELAKLGPGESGDKAALKAAIGCSAAELAGAIDALKYSGKIGFYGLVLSESMRAKLAPAHPVVEPERSIKAKPEVQSKPQAALGPGLRRGTEEIEFAPPPPARMASRVDGAKGSGEAGGGPVSDVAPQFFGRPPRRGARRQIPLPEGMRPTVEAIQSALAEDPMDAIAAVRRRHPGLWRRAIALSRAARVTPASAFFDALERGLERMEAAAAIHVEQGRAS